MKDNEMLISDDNRFYFEIVDDNRLDVVQKLVDKLGPKYNQNMLMIELKDWKFKLMGVGNPRTYFFDFVISDFEVKKVTNFAGEEKLSNSGDSQSLSPIKSPNK